MCAISFGINDQAKKGGVKIRFDKNLILNKIKFSKIATNTNNVIPKKESSHDIVKYVDANGVTHFVNNPEKIPAEYRNSAETNLKLPELIKADF